MCQVCGELVSDIARHYISDHPGLTASVSVDVAAPISSVFLTRAHPGWRFGEFDFSRLDVAYQRLHGSFINVVGPNEIVRPFMADPSEIRVVIVGESPYPTPGDACGHSFAQEVNPNYEGTVSGRGLAHSAKKMANLIYRKFMKDTGKFKPGKALGVPTTLDHWHAQGVMLVNYCPVLYSKVRETHLFVELFCWAVAILESQAKPVWATFGSIAEYGMKSRIIRKFPSISERYVASVHPAASEGFEESNAFERINHILSVVRNQRCVDWEFLIAGDGQDE
jgi:uracil-DNA glycosylase